MATKFLPVFWRVFRVLAQTLAVSLLPVGCGSTAPGPDLALVSDEDNNVVRVLDGRTGKQEGELRTGRRPRGLAIGANGHLFVAASGSDRIEEWDPRGQAPVRTYRIGTDPERFALTADGKSLFVANEDESLITRFDLVSGTVVWRCAVGPEPEGIALSPNGRVVAATAEASSTVHFIDAASGKLLSTSLVGSRPRDVLFLPARNEVWVSSEQRGEIAIFDATTFAQKGAIDLVPAFPDLATVQAVEMEQTRDGTRVFVAMGRGNRAAELDPVTRQVVRSFPTGSRNWGLALSPDDRRLYAVSGLSGELTIIDLVANKVAKSVALGGKPWGVEALAR